MTTITGGANGSTNIFSSTTLQSIESASLSGNSSTQFTLSNSDFTLTAQGSGIGYSGGHPHSGTITSLTFDLVGYVGTWSGFSLSVSTVWSAVSSGDVTTFDNLFFSGNDTFTSGLTSEGADNIAGYGGNDLFNFAGNFTPGTHIDGGSGTDTLHLNGDYSDGLTLHASNLVSVENITLAAGHNYSLSIENGVVDSGSVMSVDASALGATDSLYFDGIAEVDGTFKVTGGAGNDTFRGTGGNDTFNGGGGSDTVSYFLATGSVNLNLNLTTAQAVPGAGSDTLISIENIVGSSHNDTLTGNSSDNILEGGAGDDVLNGGAGSDTASYQNAFGPGVTVNLNLTGPQAVGSDAGTDTLISIENVIGSFGNDTFTGTSADNFFDGGHGQDTVILSGATSGVTIDFSGPNPVMTGGGLGHDTYSSIENFVGTNFDDTFIAGPDRSIFLGFDGGAGNDTVDYRDSLAPVSTGTGDQLHSIENILGSPFNDQLIDGSVAGGSCLLNGEDGNDRILGGGPGLDTIFGGAGDDTIFVSDFSGSDVIDGGTGNDSVTVFTTSALVTLGPNTITNVETLLLERVDLVNIKTDDATVAAGTTLIVKYSQDSWWINGHDVKFDGSAETDGNFNITTAQGNDTIIGGAGDDVISTGFGNDTIWGGGGNNTINAGDGSDKIISGAGNDTIDAGTGYDTIDISLGGNDTVHAGDGNDTIIVGAALAAGDVIDGGTGTDAVMLNGDYSAGVTIGAPMLTNIESLILTAGHSYKFTMGGGNLAAGQVFTVDGSALGAGDSLVFDGSAETSGSFVFKGGAGVDILTGSVGNDVFTASAGNETLNGGGGNDTVSYVRATSGVTVNLLLSTAQDVGGGMGTETLNSIETIIGSSYSDTLIANSTTTHLSGGYGSDILDFGSYFRAGVVADGGPGFNTLRLKGDYSAGIQFTSTSLVNIQTLQLLGDHNYTITTDGTGAFTGHIVDASALGPDAHLVFNGSTQNIGGYVITGSSGDDVMTGGRGGDVFTLGAGNDTVSAGDGFDTIKLGAYFTADDSIDGGAGLDTLELNGDYSNGVVMGPITLVNIEEIQLDGGHSYKLITNDATVAAGQTLGVEGGYLGANDTLIFDGSHETDGNFVIDGGGGANILTGSAGNDTFYFGSSFGTNDVIDGGAGQNAVELQGDYSAGLIFNATMMVNVETLQLSGGSYRLIMNDANVAAGQTLTVNATSPVGGTMYFDGSHETDGNFIVNAHESNSALIGGAGNDILNDGGSNNLFMGGAGNDTLNGVGSLAMDTASYSDATGGVTVNLSISGPQAVGGGDGTDTLLYIQNLIGSNFDDTLEGNSGNNVLTGGAGNDTLVLGDGGNDTASGGGGNDTFKGGAAITSADTINGGAGNDTLILNGEYAAGLNFSATTMINIETISLGAGHNYTLTMNDGNLAAGQTMTVTGAALGASDTLHFDGSQEMDGNFTIYGGAGDDILVGGAGNDTLRGGLGADHMTGGAGNDIYVYKNAAESTGPNYDTITGFDFANSDSIDLKFKVGAIDATVATGALSTASFDTDLAASIDSAHLGKHHAVLFTPDSGDLAGKTFLIVDANGVKGYQAGSDFVIQLDQPVHLSSLGVADFV